MKVLHSDYSHKDHVLIFDNTTTHLKREEDTLSAQKMPKFTPKLGNNWDVEMTKLDPNCNPVYGSDEKLLKVQVLMDSTQFVDGSIQSLYWPEGYD
jgi:hypothetical protein